MGESVLAFVGQEFREDAGRRAVATFGGVAVEDACSRALKSGEVVVVDVPWDARWTVTGMRLAVGLQRCAGCLWRCSILVGRAELS